MTGNAGSAPVGNMNEFEAALNRVTGGGLRAKRLDVLQANLGLRCNQSCAHCHLNSSPDRAEQMSWPVMERLLEVARRVDPELVDLTGGSPELNPNFRRFVEWLSQDGHAVQVRTNLTVLTEPEMRDMPGFFRAHRVRLAASMPCYRRENVREQRGEGVYRRSMKALKRLNAEGYGRTEGLQLNLVYNPAGPDLPPEQSKLEAEYRRELKDRHGVAFTRLLTIANMPIGRFRARLQRQGADGQYLRLLKQSFNPATVEGLMCRHQVSVGWDGTLYDCDFNLALGRPVDHGAEPRLSSFDAGALAERQVVTGDHCFGCTAGCGSSCAGSLV